jgi:hypothetical protein
VRDLGWLLQFSRMVLEWVPVEDRAVVALIIGSGRWLLQTLATLAFVVLEETKHSLQDA